MAHLTYVHIHKFRGLAADTRLDFTKGPVFLLGKNGSGKSTLLGLLGALVSLDFEALSGEEFDFSWELVDRFDICFEFRLSQDMKGEFKLSLSVSGEAGLFYSLKGNQALTTLRNFTTTGEPEPGSALSMPSLANALDQKLMFVGGVGALPRGTRTARAEPFDEALGGFEGAFGVKPTARLELTSLSLGVEVSGFGVPESLTSGLFHSQTVSDEWDAWTKLDSMQGDTALVSCSGWLGAEYVGLRPRVAQRSGERLNIRGFDLRVHWAPSLFHSHSQLSFGQKRLIAFCWYADLVGQAPLLTDELTNGLHADWVDEIVALLSDRQSFHAVQNPLLVDRFGLPEPAEVQGSFVLCSVENTESGRQWSWRNPTEAESSKLSQAWDTGLANLSHLLWSEGLW